MSQTAKIALGIAVVAVVLLGGFYYWQSTHQAGPEVAPEVTTLPSGSQTSDAALEEDLASIDAQLNTASSETASANESVDAAVSAQ